MDALETLLSAGGDFFFSSSPVLPRPPARVNFRLNKVDTEVFLAMTRFIAISIKQLSTAQ